jgi:hypothetical protein
MKNLCALIFGVLFAFFLLNLILSFLPVTKGMRYLPVDQYHPIQSRDFGTYTYSEGWNFRLAQNSKINVQGFPAPYDYDSYQSNIILIGNSYIESLMLPHEQSMQAQLKTILNDGRAVYGFGLSGSHAGEYNAIASWAVKNFNPEWLVILFTENDFSDADQPSVGRSYISVDQHQCIIQTVERKSDSYFMRLVKQTNLYAYFMQNLQLNQQIPPSFFSSLTSPNSVSSYTKQDDHHIAELSHCFLNRLMADTNMLKEKIIFVLDGDRESIQQRKPSRKMDIHLFESIAKQNGFTVLNLQKNFEHDYRVNKKAFDFKPIDAHWNERAHRLAAQEVATWIKNAQSDEQVASLK